MALQDGRKYFLWSGWAGKRNGQQNIYTAPMADQVTISGTRTLIATPNEPWERVAMPICEAPQVLKRNADIFIVYSASGSWTPDSCLGLLHNKTNDVLNPASWTKHGPVFKKQMPKATLSKASAAVAHCCKRLLACQICALLLVSFGFAATAATSTPFANGSPTTFAPEAKAVNVSTRRDGDVTHFYVENKELCEITMTFEMGLENLKGSTTFPCTVTLPPQQVTETFTLSPNDPAAKWEYSYTNYYKLGSQCAKHDDSYIYQLPYASGSAFRVTQGYNGSFSHTGSNKYAIDWQMPEGTPVYAARGGMVIKVKDESDTGGASIQYDPCNNYVLIRHDDGTLAHYCHLQKNGCRVRPGQVVLAGDFIARSGNTGFSSGPHLHFCVFKTKNGRERESIPVKFKTAGEKAITLRTGRNYKASVIESASARPTTPEATHRGGAIQ